MRQGGKHIRMVCMAALALLAVGLIHRPGEACGFHASIFQGNFHDTWYQLQNRMDRSVKQWDFKKRRHVTIDQFQAVVAELLQILRFVDLYNSAPDSPPWMHSEEGRENARESAKAILVELGVKAAPKVWQAVVDDIRFDTPQRNRALTEARAAIQEAETAEQATRMALQKHAAADPRLKNLVKKERNQALAVALVSLNRTHAAAHLGQKAVRRPLPTPNAHMKLSGAAYIPSSWSSIQKHNPVLAKANGMQELFDTWIRAQSKASQAVTSFAQRFEHPQGYMYSDMLPVDAYRSSLLEVLHRIGKPLQPLLSKETRHANAAVRETAKTLWESIENRKETPPEKTLEELENEPIVLARLAWTLWDLGGGEEHAAAVKIAKENLAAGGMAQFSRILTLWEKLPMPFAAECEQALEIISGEKLGTDSARWRSWYGLHIQHSPPLIGQQDGPVHQVEKVLIGDGLFPPLESSKPKDMPKSKEDEAWVNEAKDEFTEADRLLGRVPREKKKDTPAPEFEDEDENVPAYERR